MNAKKTFSTSELKKAVQGSGGIISNIARRLKCDWHTAKRVIEANDKALIAYKDEEEKTLDLAESKLLENIGNNDNTGIIFFLKTKGKKRGYIERQEISGPNGSELFKNEPSMNDWTQEQKDAYIKNQMIIDGMEVIE